MENHDAFTGLSAGKPTLNSSKAGSRKDEHSSRHKSTESLDTVFARKVRVFQSRSGYRFSLDSLLLANFVTIKGAEKVVDLGSGNAIIPLLLAHLYSPITAMTGIEIQPAMVERARRNVAVNGLDKRVKILQGDVREIGKHYAPADCDVVVCNPPYRKLSSGRISVNDERRIARHELNGDLDAFLRAGAFLLRNKGRMALVYLAGRSADLIVAMRQAGIEPKRLRMVHSFPEAEASLILLEGVKGGKAGLAVLPPLVIYRRAKQYTDGVTAIINGVPR
ncbi:MAG: tRNA1(Val) (adenine(37)-N6)-methyltransferase [Candidatus Binatia bacterium]